MSTVYSHCGTCWYQSSTTPRVGQSFRIEGGFTMKLEKKRQHAIVVALAVTLFGSWLTAARAQAPEARFAAVLDAARAHPGCLGVDTGQTRSGRQGIFAWFEN